MEEFVLVEDHFLARFANDIVELGELDGIDGACLFAHPAEDTAEHVDLELGGVFFAIIPWRFGGFDMDAVCWADRGAHHACNTFDASVGVAVETMDASEVGKLHPALFNGVIFPALFGVLDGSACSSLPEGGEEMPHGGAKPLDDIGDIDRLRGGHGFGNDGDDVFFFDGHTVRV